MVTLVPFRGIVPVGDELARSVDGSRTSTQRLRQRERHPRHVAWLESDGSPVPGDLDAWLAEGSLRQDDAPRLRVVAQVLPDGRLVAGVLGLVPLDDLVRHERVDAVAVRRRTSRDRHEPADLRPLLAVLGDPDPVLRAAVDEVLAGERELDARDDDGVRHVVAVPDPEASALLVDHVAAGRALLADGHHRVAAARRAGRRSLPTLVSLADAAPRLLPVWRVAVTGAEPSAVTAWLAREGDPEGELHVRWHRQRTRRAVPHGVLPVVAGDRLVRSLPGLQRVTTTSDPGAVAVAERDGAVVVGAPAPTVDDVLEAVTSGRPLPAKSTSFHPKPRIGLVLQRADRGD